MPAGVDEQSQAILPPVAMHDRYGPLLRSFFARYFNPIPFPTEAIERIRQLSREGTLVYVAPAANLLHFLYLNHVCIRHDLPLARFVSGLDPVLLQPLDLLWDRLRKWGDEGEHQLEEEGELQDRHQMIATVQAGEATLLFLDRPSTITNPNAETDHHLLQLLIQIQLTQDTPLFLLPQLIKWNVHPEREDKGVADAIFGEAEAPGFLRSLFELLRHYRRALVKVAEPIDLKAFIRLQDEHRPEQLAASLHDALQTGLQLEVYDIAGPRIRPHLDFCEEILADEKIQRYIADEAGDDEAKAEALRKQAFDLLDEIAAEPRIRWPLALNRILNLFWKRMYQGFAVDQAGFDKIRAAVRKGPIVFCPSHKSHVDYLVLSQLCLQYQVPLPHIAAGVNLAFWPVGPIFRHSGAFFLRRSFKGNKLYPVVFRTYLRHVMKEGFPIELFIEGTRSRTGKLLGPRYGILSWLVQAFLEGTGEDLHFVPISIDYEKIVESRAYLRELSGGEKDKEDVSGLLKSSRALRAKYGQIYVQIADPISIKQVLAEPGFGGKDLDEAQRRQLAQELAHQILFEINTVSTVTPSALVAFCLLNHRRRGMTHNAFLERAHWLLGWIRRRNGRLSASLKNFERALGQAIARFSRDGLVTIRDTGIELVYSVVERRRLALDYYRNNLIHYFVPSAITMLALESFTVEAVPFDAASQRIRQLSRLFKHEFLFRSERHFEDELRRALDDLSGEGAIREENGFVVKVAEAQTKRQTFKAILEHFVEAYWLSARSLAALDDGPLAERDLISRALQLGRHLFVQGEVLLRESLSREMVKTALKAFADRGLIENQPAQGRKGPLIQLTPAGKQAGALPALAEEIHGYLNRP